jgi:hypothetical protein
MKLGTQQIDAIRAFCHRHTPVADNHYPDVREGDCVLHAYSSGDLWDVAIHFPPEEEEDPTAGLWWVLIPRQYLEDWMRS